jgi:hypothetical protein
MSERTARIAEVCRRAVTPGDEGHISTDHAAARLASVENVKRNIINRRAANLVVDEWHKAKEEMQKRSLHR